MIEALGIAAFALIVAAATFLLSIAFMEKRRWWSQAGLAAFIPMLAVAIPMSLATATIAVWLIK